MAVREAQGCERLTTPGQSGPRHLQTTDIHERDGGPLVLAEIVKLFPAPWHIIANGGYVGDKLKDAPRRISK